MKRAAILGLEAAGRLGVVEGPAGAVGEVPPEDLTELETGGESGGLHVAGHLFVGLLDVVAEGRRESAVGGVLVAEAGGGFDGWPSGYRWTQTADGGLSGGRTSSWEKAATQVMLLARSSAK